MAEIIIGSRLISIFFFFSVFFCPYVCSRAVVKIPKTSVLDVSASIERINEILSVNPETLQQQELQQQSDSFLTLRLYSRDTLAKSQFKSYRDLILSQLERDSARVQFIYKKLNAADESDLNTMDLGAPLTPGRRQGTSQYLARFGVGTPPQQFYIAIDTGSDVTWIQCAPCARCYNQTDPIFDPSKSSSFQSLTCASQQCQQLRSKGCTKSNKCIYGVSYGDQSFTVGILAIETLTSGASSVNGIAIGCGLDNEGLFSGQAGLFGLGRGPLSFPSQFKASAFSYCLVDRSSASASTLDFGTSSISSNSITTPMLQNSAFPSFYYVGLTGLSVGGKMLPISPSAFAIGQNGKGGVIVDSGTIVTRLPRAVYSSLRDEFLRGTTGLPTAGRFSLYDTCYDFTSKSNVTVPTVGFHFGEKSWILPPENYLVAVGNYIFCFAFAATDGPLSIIGNIQQQGTRVSFDVGRSLIAFSPNQC